MSVGARGGTRHLLRSGRAVEVPSIPVGKTASSARGAVARMDAWLLETMRSEAEARFDDWTPALFESEKPGRFPQATRDALNDYIFDGARPLEEA